MSLSKGEIMETSNISLFGSGNLYEPKEIDKRIIDEEASTDWLFYRDIINSLFKEKFISSKERYSMLLALRKELGLFCL